jgi:hypothetical protein
MGEGLLAASLSRDPISCVRASEAAGEVEAFLCVAAPEICRDGRPGPALDGFVFRDVDPGR